MRLRLIGAIMAGKLAIFLSRLAGNQGTDFPGQLARKLCPSILQELAGRVEGEIIIVTGTNGKTTTTNMIAEILRENGSAYVHNRAGANMLTGITTAFIQATSFSGRRCFDYALLETDEANVPLLLQEVKASLLLVTNFFRDQLDRYGELDHTINLIKAAVKDSSMELVLNADDPLQSDFAVRTGLQCWYYGFDDTIYDELTSADSREGRYCVFCGDELGYKRYHYAQLGEYRCPNCGNHNPAADFTARHLQMETGISLQVGKMDLQSSYQGFYNAYNILAAVSMGRQLGIEAAVIQRAILKYQPRAGRMEKFVIDGKPCLLVLVKNPTGLNQNLEMLALDRRRKSLFIALNDNAADGRDISWIWDADVEAVARPEAQIKKIICSGQRSGDMALRIKYAGYPTGDIIIDSRLREGIALTVAQDSQAAFILCTYTALFACRQIMLKMQRHSSGAAVRAEARPKLAAGQEEE